MNKNAKFTKKNNLNKKIVIIIGSIIIIVLLVLLSLFVIKKIMDDDFDDSKVISNNRVSEEGKVKYHDPSDGMHVSRIMKLIAGGEDCNAFEEFANNRKVYSNDITAYRVYYATLEDSFYNSSKNEISLKEFQEAAQKIFGKEYSFNPDDVELDKVCAPYKYNSSTKKFIKQKSSCKLSCGINKTIYNLISVKEEYGKYIIDVNVLFGSRNDEVAFYSDYDRTNLVTNNFSDASSGNLKGSIYRFVFESEGSEYSFVSSELINE